MKRTYIIRWLVPVALAALVFLGSGCGLVRTYRCVHKNEQEAFNTSARSIYPDDIRLTPEDYINKGVVAWVGIILESYHTVRGDEIEVELVLEHHHFDWLEDFRLGENMYILSGRGEGRFRTGWLFLKKLGLDEIKRRSTPGRMVVVYGQPIAVEKGIIELRATYVRFVESHRFRFAQYPYGRDVGFDY